MLRPNLSTPEPPPIDGGNSANTKADGKAVTVAADTFRFDIRKINRKKQKNQ